MCLTYAALCPLGHNLAEMVSVQAYLCSETTPLTWVGGASLEYVQDDAQVCNTYNMIQKIGCKFVDSCGKNYLFIFRF